MPLTPNDPLVKKAETKAVDAARLYDQRHRLHAESATDAASASPYFRSWVTQYLEPTIPAKSAREQVLRDIVWPLVSNELVDDISDSAAAVHGAQDRFISIELTDEKLQADAEQYIEQLDIDGFVARDCHNAVMSAPNSLVVVDLPAVQTTDFPEPYPYLLSIEKVQKALPAVGANKAGLLQFAYFDTEQKNQRALFDESDYAIFEKANGTTGEWVEKLRFQHSLGFCPAFKLWADVDRSNPLVSNTLLRPSLGLLDRYIFWDAAQHSNDLKAAFAQFWHLEAEEEPCRWISEQGMPCVNGSYEYQDPITPSITTRHKCPSCASKVRRARGGPGSVIPIPAQQKREDADWRVPAGWIDAPIDSLKYIQEKVEFLRAKIRRTATGSEAGPQNEQALNESQILSILEAARQVGQYLAEYFEMLHKRILEAVLRLRYGPYFVGCTVNYGRRFAALSGDLLMKLAEMAKTNGSFWLMEEIDGMLQNYYARSDASRSLRFKLINDLNPYPYMAPADLMSAGIHTSDPKGYQLAVGLMGFIRRFEREEQIPIERFGILTPYSSRVTTILDALKSYVDEIEPAQPARVAGDADPNNPTGDPAGGSDPGGQTA
ncbi:hypothetical protein [Spirosoma sordidisoli]|uniref:Uncharacterized protein n=1 Tax=Spirosoma sordidisoli TaxID=2502893 RepID=A0A4Q2UML5_9BACT|nr:hypothetical protein [Spirosoma sordidisoli]RYC70877.1 hypothetical protein EQG79_01615 [Spirosoma sordidisoli]